MSGFLNVLLSEKHAAAGGDTAQALAFVARLDGNQNATHTTAYKTLINGLVNDASGIWGCLDVLCVFAANNTTNALLNLVSTSFNPSELNSPSFTADAGYTGVASTNVIDTNYNPTTASGNFVQNDAHISVWNNTNSTNTIPLMGVNDAGPTVDTSIFCYTGTAIYGRINDTPSSGPNTSADGRGLIVATRSGASTQNLYKIKSSSLEDLSPTSTTSHAPANLKIYVLGLNNNGTASADGAHQVMSYSIGKNLSQAQATALYTWLDGYLVTIAGISY